MDFHLIYSKEAIADLEAILDEITADNPAADSRFGISLYEHISLLKLFPRMGTPVRDRPQVRTLNSHTDSCVLRCEYDPEKCRKYFTYGKVRVPLRNGYSRYRHQSSAD